MCDYEVRVDIELAKRYASLAIAHMAQAIINGDLSLLIPELTMNYQSHGMLHNLFRCPNMSS